MCSSILFLFLNEYSSKIRLGYEGFVMNIHKYFKVQVTFLHSKVLRSRRNKYDTQNILENYQIEEKK